MVDYDHTANPADIPLKQCPKCGEWKPATSEYFHRDSDARSGYQSLCRECRNLSRRKPPKPRTVPEDMSKCSYCKRVLPATREYFTVLLTETGTCHLCNRERVKNYTERNPEKVKEMKRIYNALHTEEQRAYSKKHAERRRKYAKQYWLKHGSKYLEQMRIRTHLWAQDNPDRNKENQKRRKERQCLLMATFTVDDWTRALNHFNNCCVYCGRPQGFWHKMQQDHYIPLSAGGHYTADNIIPACGGLGGCNQSKSDSAPVEWITLKFGARKAKAILARIAIYFEQVAARDAV